MTGPDVVRDGEQPPQVVPPIPAGGPTAEGQAIAFAGSLAGLPGRRRTVARVVAAAVLLAGAAVGVVALVQTLGGSA